MKTTTQSRPAPDFATLLPALGAAHGHRAGRYHNRSGGTSVDTSATHPSADGRDAAWDRTAAFDDDDSDDKIASEENLPAGAAAHPHAAELSSPLFQYFCLLCEYHGAATVPSYWATLLASSDTHPPMKDSLICEQVSLLSPATTIDFAACYVGPNALLAFADLCRVHRVRPARRQQQQQPQSSATGVRGGANASSALTVVVTAVAPLWSKGRAAQTSTPSAPAADSASGKAAVSTREASCSLLPQLRTLKLTHLSLDFSLPPGGADTSSPRGGGPALQYLLEALQGHPQLQRLDLSYNPIAAALVPALSRLLQSTPTLTALNLDHTLLAERDKAMLSAQCELNQLRLERQAAQSPANASPAPNTYTPLQLGWAAQTFRDVQAALEIGTAAVPWLLGTSTAYVRRYSTNSGGAGGALSTSVTGAGSSTTRPAASRKSASYSTFDAIAAASQSALLPSFRLGATGGTYLCYDSVETSSAASTAASTTLAGTSPAAAAAAVAGSTPASRDAETSRAGLVWTSECAEVVRCAFLDRQVARQRVLGGRVVWPNVPLPSDVGSVRLHTNRGSTSGTMERGEGGANGDTDERKIVKDEIETCRPTVEVLSASRLLRSIRQQLLPPPQAPPGMRRDADAAFLTTAEENYWTTRQTQDKQWGFLVGRLAELLEPVQVQDGQVLYAEGDVSSACVYFLPPELATNADTETYVALQAGRDVNRVLPGQWVGEAEALGCQALYANSTFLTINVSAASSTSTSAALHTLGSTVKAINTSTPFARLSTARFVCPSSSPSVNARTIWALPFSVAFFYLYAPYQQLQQQFMQRTPMSSFAHIHPVLLAAVPVQLELFRWTRQTNGGSNPAQRSSAAAAATVLCTSAYLHQHLVLLQEGEYILRVPLYSAIAAAASALGVAATEQHLLSGNAVVTQAVLDLDEAARAADRSAGDGDEMGNGLASSGRGALGKEAALREFRVRKAAAVAAATAAASRATSAQGQAQRSGNNSAKACGATSCVDENARESEAAAAAASESNTAEEADMSADQGEQVELRPYPSTAPVAHWRYAGLSNDAFAALCPPLRLALTRHCCVMPEEN